MLALFGAVEAPATAILAVPAATLCGLAFAAPLFHGVQLCRQLSVGVVDATALVHVGLLFALTALGLAVVKLSGSC